MNKHRSADRRVTLEGRDVQWFDLWHQADQESSLTAHTCNEAARNERKLLDETKHLKRARSPFAAPVLSPLCLDSILWDGSCLVYSNSIEKAAPYEGSCSNCEAFPNPSITTPMKKKKLIKMDPSPRSHERSVSSEACEHSSTPGAARDSVARSRSFYGKRLYYG